MMNFLLTSLLAVSAGLMMMGDLRADTFGTGTNQFAIDFVSVTNAGNANDAGAGGGSYSSPYGGVGYNFRISTYEISQDMIDKATAGGLANVTAGVHTGTEPAGNVTWYEAAAFVNWLNEDAGYHKAYDLTWDGSSWTMSLWSTENASTLDGTNLFRHKGAYYVLPSEDEWHKAAYHKNDGVTANYWDYPTGSNGVPAEVASGTNAGTAVYGVQADPADVDQAGGLSPYGTMGQGGNVWEWMESAYDGINNSASDDRLVRGGSWTYPEFLLRSSLRNEEPPAAQHSDVGFRVAAVPRTPSLAVANTTGNDISLTMNGNVGLPHAIEVSDDLTNWQPWAIVTLPAGGWSTNFPTDPEIPRRFWRARHGDAPPGFVLVPPGNFQMGDSFTEGGTAERPVHTVYVSAFYMQATETTKAQWDEVRTWGSTHGYTDLSAGGGKAEDHPVQTVSWYDVVKWCNARSEKESLVPCYTVGGATYKTGSSAPVCNFSASGYRLPTEAEWEKAARGGATGRRFPWSDADTITHSRGNYHSSTSYAYDVSPTRGYHPTFATGGDPYTSPVGYFAANGYGLHDMAGNVWEWCWDWHWSSYYGISPPSDPSGPTSGSSRVLRGGYWGNDPFGCRVASRSNGSPGYGYSSHGFRPVRR